MKTFGKRNELTRNLAEIKTNLINDGSGKDQEQTHQAGPTNPTGTIRHDRQSVVWLVEPAWKAIVTLL